MISIDVDDIEQSYHMHVIVPLTFACPHGEGRTVPAETGVRIECPAGRDCWFVKWEFAEA